MEQVESREVSVRDRYRSHLTGEFEEYLEREVIGRDRLNILSVGCGIAYESEPLLRLFPDARYRGIDIDNGYIELARDTNDDIPEGLFDVADARKKEAFGINPWDIIILRNPQVLGRLMDFTTGKMDEGWKEIIGNCVEALVDKGLLFISVDTEPERKMILEYLGTRKLQVLVNEENKHKSTQGTCRDDFVVVAKKL